MYEFESVGSGREEESPSSRRMTTKVVVVMAAILLVVAGAVVVTQNHAGSQGIAKKGLRQELSKSKKYSSNEKVEQDSVNRAMQLIGHNSYRIYMSTSSADCTLPLGASGTPGTVGLDLFTSRITVMCFRAGSLLDQIKFSRGSPYAAPSALTFRTYGGNGGADEGCFRAYSGCINKIEVRAGGAVDGIQLTSSDDRVSKWYGGTGGAKYEIIGGDRCLDSISVGYSSIIERISFCFDKKKN